MIKLSITIPTYDRPEQLLGTLRSLFDCIIPDYVEIIILDNASPIPVEKLVRAELPHAAPRVRFIRNSSNIGLAANLMRCFEHAHGEWTWLLGDDDSPLPDAIRFILEETRLATPSDVLIKFNSTNGGNVGCHDQIANIEELSYRCQLPGFYSNLLFISSGVFRTSRIQANLQTGYHWGYTMAPHVAIILTCMVQNDTIRLAPFYVVKHGMAEPDHQWNMTRLVTGFNALADLEGGGTFRNIAMPSIIRLYLGGKWYRRMLGSFLTENGRSLRFWQIHYIRLAAVYGGMAGWFMTQIAWLFPIFVKIFRLRRMLSRWIKTTSSTHGLNRS